MASRRQVKKGGGLLNTAINHLPIELHLPGYQYCGPGTNLKKRLSLGQKGINGLDSACKDHDIAYDKSNSFADRDKADEILENRAWDRFKSKDADFKERVASLFVSASMKTKRKIGCGFKNVVGVAKKAIKKLVDRKTGVHNITKLIKSAIAAVKKYIKNTKTCKPRIIKVPKVGSGVTIPLIPIFSALSALGTLIGGAGNVMKVIKDVKSGSGMPIKLGGGMFLHPYKRGSGSYKIVGSKRSRLGVKSRTAGKKTKN